ncbi:MULTISPECIES: FecR family protein [unclassified Phyllobacterium]|uniref:FecR family protein n=1 Tax=unclassified Phyllobacterium TaxID=2638441 RepID=UPI003012FB44
MNQPKNSERSTLPETERLAIEWFTRMNGEPSTLDREQFDRWIAADRTHSEAYRRVVASWDDSGIPGENVAAEESRKLDEYLQAMDAAKARKRGTKTLASIVFFLAVLSGFGIWLERPGLLEDMRADYTTGKAQRKTIRLPDATEVLMDADSALAEHFTEGERRIELLRGAAYFSVTHSSVPFIVQAQEGETKVLGTQFDVTVQPSGVQVTLAQGRVAVTANDDERPTTLFPGESVSYDENGVGAIDGVDVSDAMSWHTGRYTFNNARLADVLRQIERYRDGRIIVRGKVAERRVSGSFTLSDTDAALDALQSSVGFSMSQITSRVVIVGGQ